MSFRGNARELLKLIIRKCREDNRMASSVMADDLTEVLKEIE